MNLIRKIRLDDYAQISKIIKLVFFKQNNLQNGFLMSHIRKNIFEKLINSSKYCYVLEEDNGIKAFLLAYSNTLIKPTNDINKHIINSFKDKFIYIYQIGVSPKFQKMGLGTLLYKKLFKDAKGQVIRVISSAKPYNMASEKFHLSLSFKKIGLINRNDGGSNYIYERTEQNSR